MEEELEEAVVNRPEPRPMPIDDSEILHGSDYVELIHRAGQFGSPRCSAMGKVTEDPKKVTCDDCKEIE